MAKQQFAFVVAQVHPVPPAISEVFAFRALFVPHPFPMPVRIEFTFPYLHEIVFVDIALMIIRPDAGTSRNSSVDKNRAYCDSSLARKEMIAHFAFVVAEEPFASVAYMDTPLFPAAFDKFHYFAKPFA